MTFCLFSARPNFTHTVHVLSFRSATKHGIYVEYFSALCTINTGRAYATMGKWKFSI